MSTRAVYSFFDGNEAFHVYKHSDGYPEGAFIAISNALPCAWTLPRFEADEFAAAFVAGNKCYWKNKVTEAALVEVLSLRENLIALDNARDEYGKYGLGRDGGGVRLLQSGRVQDISPPDIEYRYEIRCLDGKLYVKAYRTNYWDDEKVDTEIFSGTLAKFKTFSKSKKAAA